MRMRARYSLVYEEIFECDCTPTSVSRNIIYFIYILIGPDRHGSKENPSHHSSATFIGSLPLLARSVLFSSSLSNRSLCFQNRFRSLLRDHPHLDLSHVSLSICLISALILFFHFSFFSRASFLQLSFDLHAIFLLTSTFVLEYFLHVMVISSFQLQAITSIGE